MMKAVFVRNAKFTIDGIISGCLRQVEECRQEIEATAKQLDKLEQKRQIMAPSRDAEVEYGVQRLTTHKELLEKRLPFLEDWRSRENRKVHGRLTIARAELRQAYEREAKLLFNEVLDRVAQIRTGSEEPEAYLLGEIFELCQQAGELLSEGFSELGYFPFPPFAKLGLDELEKHRKRAEAYFKRTLPKIPDWDNLGTQKEQVAA